jgi:hypothetical protein
MNEVFFDSHGQGWITCAPEAPEAVAFGPSGASRKVDLNFAEARERTFVADDGWCYLDGPGWGEEGRPSYYG